MLPKHNGGNAFNSAHAYKTVSIKPVCVERYSIMTLPQCTVHWKCNTKKD